MAAFTGGQRELLVLDGKPSMLAMERHGKQWNALGADGTGPAEHVLAGQAVAVIVNPGNGVESLTMGQVRGIYSGEIEDWSGLGVAGGRINKIGLPGTSAAVELFEKEALPAKDWKRVARKKDAAAVISAVGMDRNAIGFVDLTDLRAGGQNVRVLGIQVGRGARAQVVRPITESIRNAMYPLSRRIYLYVHPNASKTAKSFAEFLATSGASASSPYAETIKAVMDTYGKHGLIPLADEAVMHQAKRATEWTTASA